VYEYCNTFDEHLRTIMARIKLPEFIKNIKSIVGRNRSTIADNPAERNMQILSAAHNLSTGLIVRGIEDLPLLYEPSRTPSEPPWRAAAGITGRRRHVPAGINFVATQYFLSGEAQRCFDCLDYEFAYNFGMRRLSDAGPNSWKSGVAVLKKSVQFDLSRKNLNWDFIGDGKGKQELVFCIPGGDENPSSCVKKNVVG
jgi:hypothetical protein